MDNPIPKKPKNTFRILHTSDWHIGKRLFSQSRYDEFEAFLNWLFEQINLHKIDALIVAGDIFDTATPSNKAQELYYEFLGNIAKSPCQHVIIIAGNHDSPTFLDAPKAILKSLNVQVIGQITDNLTDEMLVLCDHNQNPQAIILAIPYLRDKDVRSGGSFEAVGQREQETAQGIATHYQTLAHHAQIKRTQLAKNIPIIATGHLFVAGSSVSSSDDGMRQEIFVGTLGQISADIFDQCLDYVALGHIHAPQKVAGQDHVRYCGSPIAMGFGEAGKTKQVLVVDFECQMPAIYSLSVPTFVELVRLEGDMDAITSALSPLIAQDKTIYAEIIYTGTTLAPNFAQDIKGLLTDTKVVALNIQNTTQRRHILQSHQGNRHPKNLKNLSQIDVFEYLLDKRKICDDEKPILKNAYLDIIKSIHEQDDMAN
ncbi:MAG: exonuclease SbcCD subunit D C-terminal domain-containing protein [Moraxella sp.]|uniref:exonuclease SbcCD subunit D C-terminal domain-containing protein n=1 Tax=Moraxella sp. TaxID=479 RepID=UPI0026DC4F04|nr:exonuclease SbcCD subunit D C-terminal domain-containing protein [Moraxella sp.]MDO4449331.1 exonuclease SbcCD subunit D C-terminal domain-containing protein [Moraxella sp.]